MSGDRTRAPGGPATPADLAFARHAFIRACRLDVAVPKPGNVSHASPGHGMHAGMFEASAEAAAAALFEPGGSVGTRIEAAVTASLAVAGCNTNLGIVLLAAPVAQVLVRGLRPDRRSLQEELARLTRDDADAAFRAIVAARPGGLGHAADGDVHRPATLTLLQAMELAAGRDRIARQYALGYEDVFMTGLPMLGPEEPTDEAVQRLFLAYLAAFADSHIVRKQGPEVAHSVMRTAQHLFGRPDAVEPGDLLAFDRELKSSGVNPGTTADLAVVTLWLAALEFGWWHGT